MNSVLDMNTDYLHRIINVNLKMYKFAHLRMYNFIISQNLHNNL